MPQTLNQDIAGRLDEVAHVLEQQGASRFRVRAYAHAASVLRALPESVADVYARGGLEGLEEIPGVGRSIAHAIRDIVCHGRLAMLDRLRGESDPLGLLTSVPGIGQATAQRIHDELGIETLEELEAAAHDGRLAGLGGLGAKRLAGIRDSLAQRLQRVRRPGAVPRAGARAVGGRAAGRGRRVPAQGRKRGAAEDRAAPFQPRTRSLAAGAACHARQASLHRALLQHPARPRAGNDARLGGALLRRRRRRRTPQHRHHLPVRSAARAAHRSRARAGVRRSLRHDAAPPRSQTTRAAEPAFTRAGVSAPPRPRAPRASRSPPPAALRGCRRSPAPPACRCAPDRPRSRPRSS